MRTLITALTRLVAAPIIEIPKHEYQAEILKFFGDSRDLMDELEQQEEIYKKLGGTEHCISTGNILFRYKENELKKQIFIVGIIAKSGRIEPKDLLDVKEVTNQFMEKLLNSWIIIASVNANSRKMIDRLKQAAIQKGEKIYERSLGQVQYLDRPEFKFDTIVIGTDQNMLTNFRV